MTAQMTIEQLYERHIKMLPAEDRLRLLAVIAQELAPDDTGDEAEERSILDLEGLGAELWRGVDAQQYVDELRDEWDIQRPS